MSLAYDHLKDPMGLGLTIYTALNEGKSLDDLKPKPQLFDAEILKRAPEALNRTTMSGKLMDIFTDAFPQYQEARETTSAFATARLVTKISNQLELPLQVKEALVSNKIDHTLLVKRNQEKVAIYPHLKLINAEGNQKMPSESRNYDIAPDLDHDWKWQVNIPDFVTETISLSRTGFEKTITLNNGSRLSLGVNAEVPSKHVGEGRSISCTTCEAPTRNDSPWSKIQIVEIEGFSRGKIRYITFTTKDKNTEILIKTSQKDSLESSVEEPIVAKILSKVSRTDTFGNPVIEPFKTLQELATDFPNEPALRNLMALNSDQLNDTARNAIHNFVTK